MSQPPPSGERSKRPINSDRPRMLFVTRDTWPATRVDLTELFSRHLQKRIALTWLMPRECPGPAQVIYGELEEVTILSQRFEGGSFAKIKNEISHFFMNITVFIQVVSGKYDAVQVRDAVFSGILFLISAKITRKPFFYWMSFPMLEGFIIRAVDPSLKTGLLKRSVQWIYGKIGKIILYNIVMNYSDHVFVQSERMKFDVSRENKKLNDIMTSVPMGVSTEIYNLSSVAPSMDDRLRCRRVLLYLGTMNAIRSIEILVEATAKVVISWPDVCLVLVGEISHEEKKNLIDTANRYGISDILIFTGRLPLNEALGYVRVASVCLSPMPLIDILMSASPTKLVEYLAMARPVVANDHPDQMAVIAESGAGICVPYTADSFSAAICELLDNPSIAEEMAARGPAWVQTNRDYAALSRRTAEVYGRLIPGFRVEGDKA